MPTESLAERVKRRVVRLYDEGRFKQNIAAERLNMNPASLHGYVRGSTDITLHVLEVVSELTQVPVGELVVPEGSLIKELDADEAALLRHLRKWPKSVVRSLVGFLAFFADEPPVDVQTRNLHEMWRRFDRPHRERLFLLAQLMSEGLMTPDLLEGLQDRLVADRLADAGADGSGSRRRRERT